MIGTVLRLNNGDSAPLAGLPVLAFEDFRQAVVQSLVAGGRVSAFFGYPLAALSGGRSDGPCVRVVAVLARDCAFDVVATDVLGAYPSLTPECPQFHWFERELAEQWGVVPEGHPWLKPLRVQSPAPDFFSMSGEEVHEVAVGPVHAGVIEPGHFRFQCHGETVFHLEISLGYQHRGIENALVGGPHVRSVHQVETSAGDTAVGHSWAYSAVIESLSGVRAPARALVIRALALELERLANHIIDLGMLAGDVGFLPTLNYAGRLRGEALNTTTLVCGNRMGRGWVRPGGVRYDLAAEMVARIRGTVERFEEDATDAVDLLWSTPSVMGRFETTGVVSTETAKALGLVGVAGRASGLAVDSRADLPLGAEPDMGKSPYRSFKPAVLESGDVHARGKVRWQEVLESCRLIRSWLGSLPEGPVTARASTRNGEAGLALAPESIAVSAVEGWRGEVCHVAVTDREGRFLRYKIVDPSFHNWQGLAMALRDQAISDFPLCNKSFNLSYCGHDL